MTQPMVDGFSPISGEIISYFCQLKLNSKKILIFNMTTLTNATKFLGVIFLFFENSQNLILKLLPTIKN